MILEKTIKNLRELEKRSTNDGYMGDATDYAFKRHLLILLSKRVKHKRKHSAWSLFLGEYLRNGKSIQDASRDWKQQK